MLISQLHCAFFAAEVKTVQQPLFFCCLAVCVQNMLDLLHFVGKPVNCDKSSFEGAMHSTVFFSVRPTYRTVKNATDGLLILCFGAFGGCYSDQALVS